MRKNILLVSLTIAFLIFGAFGFIFVKEQVVNPLLDVRWLTSEELVRQIKTYRGRYPSPKNLVMWNSKILNIAPQTLIAEAEEDASILGDASGNWIEINLSTQTLCFHEMSGSTPCFPVSTGLSWTPTPTGNFHVWIKLPVTTMAGPGYYLPGVHWTMYFYGGYGTHEAYWHNNFGHPMSHGCVNMRIDDAKYIFDRSEVGTLVNIHY